MVEGPAGNGFVFEVPHGKALRDALYRAITLFRTDPVGFHALQVRGMRADHRWSSAVPEYERAYQDALAARAAR